MKKLKTIKLPVCKPALISDATGVFSGWIDSDFTKYGLDSDSKAKEMSVDVYQLTTNMTFTDMFSLPETMWLTQGQIIEFCKNHQDEILKTGYDNFFLLKKNDNFFVADVAARDDGRLNVRVDSLEYDSVWCARYQCRVIVPHNTLTLENSPLDTFVLSDSLTRIEKFLEEIKALLEL